ncbi:MAG TPA: PQQ-binding-like beta-propeller repeat protein [Candidatus Baltobacteraceae bacterium]|nr:PQQ-binding-like beta-propeller repeat protein [Candidatus Baltobacteraceae bacterium]
MLRHVTTWFIVLASLGVVALAACSGGAAQNPTTKASPGATPTPSPVPTGAALSWPVFGHDPARSGVDVGDTTLTTTNVSQLVEKWQISFGSGNVADSTPILLANIQIGGTAQQMLYQTDKNGETFAIEAQTGKVIWTYTTSGPNITQSTPAADPSGQAIYVPGVDGKVHKLDAATGAEMSAPGFPATITTIPNTEKDASALNVANGYLYATTSGYYGDTPYYDGHVVSVNLSTGATSVFNSLCSSQTTLPTDSSCPNSDSGIWARGGAVVDPYPSMNGDVYVATGNGLYDGSDNYGDSVIALTANLSMIGSYTPTTYASLQNGDIDLGSTSPTLLPVQSTSTTPLMLVQGGKDSTLRLLNRSPLPGVGGELQEIDLPDRLYATPAVWTNPAGVTYIFFGLPNQIDAYELETNGAGASSLVEAWSASDGSTSGEGTSPVVSNGIVFVAMDNAIYALSAQTGNELWSSASTAHSIGPVHWQSPIVVNGWVYCSDQNGNLTAYGLP